MLAARVVAYHLARIPGERRAELERWGEVLGATADDRRLAIVGWLGASRETATTIAALLEDEDAARRPPTTRAARRAGSGGSTGTRTARRFCPLRRRSQGAAWGGSSRRWTARRRSRSTARARATGSRSRSRSRSGFLGAAYGALRGHRASLQEALARTRTRHIAVLDPAYDAILLLDEVALREAGLRLAWVGVPDAARE